MGSHAAVLTVWGIPIHVCEHVPPMEEGILIACPCGCDLGQRDPLNILKTPYDSITARVARAIFAESGEGRGTTWEGTPGHVQEIYRAMAVAAIHETHRPT